MATYRTTTKFGFRTPSGAVGEAPDGPGGMATLADDIEAAFASAQTFGPADLNTYFTRSGVYRGSGLTNAPLNSANSFLIRVDLQGTNIVQQAYSLSSGYSWTRFSTNGGSTWSAWISSNWDSGWQLSSSITPATNFGTLTGPDGVGGATSNVGGVKTTNGFLLGSFRLTYTGATITATTAGNIGDTSVCTLASAYQPSGQRYIPWHALGTAIGSARISTNGLIEILSDDPTATIPNGQVLVFDFAVPL